MDNGKRIPYDRAIEIGKTFEDRDILDADPLTETDKEFRDNLLKHGFFHYFDKDVQSTLINQKRYAKGKINKVFVKTDREDKENPDGRYIELWYDGYIEDTPENIKNLQNGLKYDNVSMGLWPLKLNENNEILDGVGVHSVLTPISAYGKVSKIYGKCSNDEQTCGSKLEESKLIDNSYLLKNDVLDWENRNERLRFDNEINPVPVFASAKELLLPLEKDDNNNNQNSINIINFSFEKTEDDKINLSQPTQIIQDVANVNIKPQSQETTKIDTNSNSNSKNFDNPNANPENLLFNNNKQFYTKDEIEKYFEQKKAEWKSESDKEFGDKLNQALEIHTKKTRFFDSLTNNDEKKSTELYKKYGKDSLSFDELQSFHKDVNTLTKSPGLESTKKETQSTPSPSEVGENNNTNTNNNEPVGATATADLIALALQKVGIIPNGSSNNNSKPRRTQFNLLEDLSLSELQGRLSA